MLSGWQVACAGFLTGRVLFATARLASRRFPAEAAHAALEFAFVLRIVCIFLGGPGINSFNSGRGGKWHSRFPENVSLLEDP
jgi:hypothetical protein